MAVQTKLSTLLRRFARQDDGVVAILFGLLLPVTLGSVALVEASKVYSVKNQLQITADSAAMASVHEVPNGLGVVQSTAETFAHRNMPADGQYGDVLVADDVEIGHWDGDAFVAGGAQENAVRVTTRGNMPLLLSAALRTLPGLSETPTSFAPGARAIALLRLDKCYVNGFVAGGVVKMNSKNDFAAGFCIYGRNGVKMNNSNSFAPGTEVGMADLQRDLQEGGNNPGLAQALVQKDISAPVPGTAMKLIDDLLGGTGPVPDYITRWETVTALPANPQPGTMYRITGSGIELSGTVQNIGIISDHPIRIKSNSSLRNVMLASRQSVDISSNVTIGDSDFCTTGNGASLIISGAAVSDKKSVPVETNSNIGLHGVQMVSDGTIEMNSNLTITGVNMQSATDISFNSSFAMSGCLDGTSANVTGDGTMVSQLVD